MGKFYRFDKNLEIVVEKNFKKKNLKEEKTNFWQISRYLNIGYYLVFPLLLLVFLGLFLKNLLKMPKDFLIIFFLLGLIGTFYNLFKIYQDLKNDRNKI